MTDSVRIKKFLKKGLKARILNVEKLMLLKPEHLMSVSELQDIDEAVIADTLKQVQAKMRGSRQQQRKNDIGEDSIKKLIEEKAGSYLDDVKKIYAL